MNRTNHQTTCHNRTRLEVRWRFWQPKREEHVIRLPRLQQPASCDEWSVSSQFRIRCTHKHTVAAYRGNGLFVGVSDDANHACCVGCSSTDTSASGGSASSPPQSDLQSPKGDEPSQHTEHAHTHTATQPHTATTTKHGPELEVHRELMRVDGNGVPIHHHVGASGQANTKAANEEHLQDDKAHAETSGEGLGPCLCHPKHAPLPTQSSAPPCDPQLPPPQSNLTCINASRSAVAAAAAAVHLARAGCTYRSSTARRAGCTNRASTAPAVVRASVPTRCCTPWRSRPAAIHVRGFTEPNRLVVLGAAVEAPPVPWLTAPSAGRVDITAASVTLPLQRPRRAREAATGSFHKQLLAGMDVGKAAHGTEHRITTACALRHSAASEMKWTSGQGQISKNNRDASENAQLYSLRTAQSSLAPQSGLQLECAAECCAVLCR